MFRKKVKTVEQRIREALGQYQGARSWPITITLVDRTVVYAGEVPTGVERRILEQEALEIPGVRDVDTHAVLLTQEDAVMNPMSAPEPLRLAAVALSRFRGHPRLRDEVVDIDEQDGTLALAGHVRSLECLVEAVHLARSVPGVSAVNAQWLTVEVPGAPGPVVPEPQGERSYRVSEGDTLSRIAQRFYGTSSESAVRRIASANALPDPEHLAPGAMLVVPGVGAGP